MFSGIDRVIVDNTNMTNGDMSGYVNEAKMQGYRVEYFEPHTPWWLDVRTYLIGEKSEAEISERCWQLVAKSTHGVPHEIMVKMLMRWEEVYDGDVESSLRNPR